MNPESSASGASGDLRVRLEEQIRNTLRPMSATPTDAVAQTEPLEGIRAVVFDVYGTLLCSGVGDIGLDDTGDRDEVFSTVLRAFGWERPLGVDSPSGLWRETIAADHGRRRSAGEAYPEVDVRELWREWARAAGVFDFLEGMEGGFDQFALAYECAVNPVWPYGDAAPTLATLQSAGYPLGIVSNAQFYTPMILETLMGSSLDTLGFLPEGRIWSYQWGCGKPATQLFELCRDRFWEREGIAPESILYVGNDALKDVWTASQVGFRTALFAGDRRSLRRRPDDARVQTAPPDRVITQLMQLPRMLGVNGSN